MRNNQHDCASWTVNEQAVILPVLLIATDMFISAWKNINFCPSNCNEMTIVILLSMKKKASRPYQVSI